MSDEIKAAVSAVETLNRAFAEFKEANDQNEKQRDTVLEAKLAKIEADMKSAEKIAEEAVLAAKRASRVQSETADGSDLDAKALSWARGIARKRGTDVREYAAADMLGYKKAFDTYMRKGDHALSVEEVKALSVGSDPDGGYVVNPDMSGRIVAKIFDTSPMRAYASIQVISTDALEGLFDLNEAGSGWVAETGARTETTTPQIGRWRIPTHELYAAPRATQKLLDDGEINMEAWLATKVAEKFARDEATAFVTGNGVNKPRGFLDYPAGTTLPGTIQQHKTGVDGGFAGAGAGVDVLLTALYSLKAQYRANASWFMNRNTMSGVRKLKDSDGAYLWVPSVAAGQPATLLGYSVAPAFEDMPDFTTTDALAIAVGDMREAYQIVDRVGIRTLRDPFTAKPYVEFYTTKRVGGDVVNFEAIKLVEFSV
jgi:HK97 family phage major capsid protein